MGAPEVGGPGGGGGWLVGKRGSPGKEGASGEGREHLTVRRTQGREGETRRARGC